jgi:hypothetical protein
MVKRVKDRSEVETKMKDRVGTAGKYLKESLEKADDPLDVLLGNPDKYIDLMVKGIQEAQRTGKIQSGLKKAKDRDAWRKSIPRAGAHYEERTDDMVDHALDDYDERKKCIESALGAIGGMPSTTRTQRISRSAEYQKKVAECFDKLYGRKA